MSEIAPSEKIQQLEQRHAQLIHELDDLNNRLEQALNSFVREKHDDGEDCGTRNVDGGLQNVE